MRISIKLAANVKSYDRSLGSRGQAKEEDVSLKSSSFSNFIPYYFGTADLSEVLPRMPTL